MVISDHYSVDSFNLVYDMGPYWQMQIGRYVNCGVILLAEQMGINQVIMQRFFYGDFDCYLSHYECNDNCRNRKTDESKKK